MDDEEFFRRSMASIGVQPLDGERHAADADTETGFAELERQLLREAIEEPAVDSVDAAPRRPSGVRRLKASSKRLRVEDQLDLHRLRSGEAIGRLDAFLQRSVLAGVRRVLVITGKGHHSPGGRGVIRERVEAWIRGPGHRYVSDYVVAPRALGGSGAFVLQLRLWPGGSR